MEDGAFRDRWRFFQEDVKMSLERFLLLIMLVFWGVFLWVVLSQHRAMELADPRSDPGSSFFLSFPGRNMGFMVGLTVPGFILWLTLRTKRKSSE